jgi:cytochrome c oxidase subunit 4
MDTEKEDYNEQHHIMSYAKLATVLGILLMLTVVTVGVSYLDMGFFNVPIALTVATIKVTFVLLYFMHLRFEGPIINISFISTVTFLIIMIGFTFWDVAYRY